MTLVAIADTPRDNKLSEITQHALPVSTKAGSVTDVRCSAKEAITLTTGDGNFVVGVDEMANISLLTWESPSREPRGAWCERVV